MNCVTLVCMTTVLYQTLSYLQEEEREKQGHEKLKILCHQIEDMQPLGQSPSKTEGTI